MTSEQHTQTHTLEPKTLEEFSNLVADAKHIIVDFYAPWCAPCKALGNVLDSMHDELATYNATVIKVDIDKLSDVANMYGVRSLPTLLFMVSEVGGNATASVLNTHVGSATKPQLQQLLSRTFENI